MKVYLVKNEYCDYQAYTNGECLLGIYSTPELAIRGRNAFVAEDLLNALGLENPARLSLTCCGDPEIISFSRSGGDPVMSGIYTITEYIVD